MTVCCVTDAHRAGFLRALGLFGGGLDTDGDGATAPLVDGGGDDSRRRWLTAPGGAVGVALRRRPCCQERAPVRRARRPTGGGAGPALPVRASGGRPLRAGRHPAVPLGRRPWQSRGRSRRRTPVLDGSRKRHPRRRRRRREKATTLKIDSQGSVRSCPGWPTGSAAAEAAGLDCVWAAETTNDPFLSLTLAAEHSTRVALGTRIAMAFARNPMSHGLHDEPAAGVLGRPCRARVGFAGAGATSNSGSVP